MSMLLNLEPPQQGNFLSGKKRRGGGEERDRLGWVLTCNSHREFLIWKKKGGLDWSG